MLKVNEIFFSIQGESSYMGLPCIFIRLTGCDLRCTYCDTEYAFEEGTKLTVRQILDRIQEYPCHLIEITGGEPLLQAGTPELVQRLLDQGYEVLIETGGHREIGTIDRRAKMIMDIKTPSSGEENKNHWENIQKLMPHDQVKFVIGNKEDYEWSKNVINNYSLTNRVSHVLMSCVFAKLPPQPLAEWILQDGLPVRFQLQMHKYIWDPKSRGV